MEDTLGKKRISKKSKNRQARKSDTYGQRVTPSRFVAYPSQGGAGRGADSENITTYSKSGVGIKDQPFAYYVSILCLMCGLR